ncbi:MAG: TRAP transporter small permease subunit [Rhizobiales bacterium]|nr:TRAP transporter small permease subunit [Hyphomicrobiales bacterium]
MSDASGTGRLPGLINRVGDALTQFVLAIAAVSLLSIVAINGANVVARYLFRSPFPWAEELMLFLMILAVFAAAIAVTWRNLHIRIDTFIERASPAVRRVALVVGTMIAIAAIMTVVVVSFRVVALLYEFDQRSDALDVPSWIPQSFVPIGLGTIALIMAVKLVLALAEAQRAAPKDSR